MEKIYLFLITLITIILTSCNSDQIEDSAYHVDFESQKQLDLQEVDLSERDTTFWDSDSLIIKLREFNQQLSESKNNEDTRGLKEKMNWIKLGLADLRGAVIGFSNGGFGGAVVLGLIYSLVCFLHLSIESAFEQNIAISNIMKMPKIECVYSNLPDYSYLSNVVVEDATDVAFEWPSQNISAQKVGINHNVMMKLYSDEYYSFLNLMPLNDEMTSSLNSIYPNYISFIKHYEVELEIKPRYLNIPGYSKEFEIISLFIEAIENNATDITTVKKVASRYIHLIDSDKTISKKGKNLLYSSISTGVYSLSFWNKHMETYALEDANETED